MQKAGFLTTQLIYYPPYLFCVVTFEFNHCPDVNMKCRCTLNPEIMLRVTFYMENKMVALGKSKSIIYFIIKGRIK